MTYAGRLVEEYFERKGQPHASALDAAYQFEMTVLRDMLSRLEVILSDEGVDRATTLRVIRCMLYGAPSPAAAELRMRQDAEMVKVLSERPPVPFILPADVAAKLGLPPCEPVLQEAAITADGWCAAHHCFPSECSGRTHVHTVRCLNSLWEKVAVQAAAKGMDTNAGVTAALEAWAAGEG